ncbi:MAG: hypothetical protein OHK0031_13460 [Anaerolineales bacterium]
MVKSGLIFGAVMFLLVLGAAVVISPLCALCVPLLAGLGAGYLAGRFDQPLSSGAAMKRGAGAGAMAALFGLAAQVMAAIINGLVLQNPQFNPGRVFGGVPIDSSLVWAGQIFAGLCVGLLNIGLTAAFGAGGAAIWWNTAGKNQPPAEVVSL